MNCPICAQVLEGGELVMVCTQCHKALGGGLAVGATGEFRVPSPELIAAAQATGHSGEHPRATNICAWCGKLEAQVKKLLKIALKQHRENREMYGYVMGGMHRSRRRNPELLIVRNPSPKGGVRNMAAKRKRRKSSRRRGPKSWKAFVKRYGVKKAAKLWRKKHRKGGKRRARRFHRKAKRNRRYNKRRRSRSRR